MSLKGKNYSVLVCLALGGACLTGSFAWADAFSLYPTSTSGFTPSSDPVSPSANALDEAVRAVVPLAVSINGKVQMPFSDPCSSTQPDVTKPIELKKKNPEHHQKHQNHRRPRKLTVSDAASDYGSAKDQIITNNDSNPQYLIDRDSKHQWKPEWTNTIKEHLPDDLLHIDPSRVQNVCKNYGSLNDVDKKIFWADFFQSISAVESGLDPKKTYPESNGAWSEGLMQLSTTDWRPPGTESWPHQIFDPAVNLRWGMEIMAHLANRYGGANIVESGSAYWSTLRANTQSGRPNKAYQGVMARLHKLSGNLCGGN